MHDRVGRCTRSNRRLEAQGLLPGQMVEFHTEVYGLVNGPYWRQTIKNSILQLGYVESRFDPCAYYRGEGGELAGFIVLEVDDLLTAGNPRHVENMERVRRAYTFGKWVCLQQEAAMYAGRQLKQKRDLAEAHC